MTLEVSRAGEILATGSHEPAGKFTFPEGEECTVTRCQISPSWGVTPSVDADAAGCVPGHE